MAQLPLFLIWWSASKKFRSICLPEVPITVRNEVMLILRVQSVGDIRSMATRIPSNVSATANLYDRNGSVIAYKTSSGNGRDTILFPTTAERGGSTPYASGGFVYSGSLYTPVEGRTVDGGYAYFAARMRSALTENNSYPVNSHGETYGSAAMAEYVGDVPTLVSAVGLDNVNGYIRFADMQTESVEGTMIPLYDQEGNVIGSFEV